MDPNFDFTLTVQSMNIDSTMLFSWTCFDPKTGITCITNDGNILYLKGTLSVIIRAGSFKNG